MADLTGVKVGDRLLVWRRGVKTYETVVRLTPTQAATNTGKKFRKWDGKAVGERFNAVAELDNIKQARALLGLEDKDNG